MKNLKNKSNELAEVFKITNPNHSKILEPFIPQDEWVCKGRHRYTEQKDGVWRCKCKKEIPT